MSGSTTLRRAAAALLGAALLGAFAAGCSPRDGVRHYHVRGVVREVQPELGQAVVEHEDVPGLMPAMTMNFELADPALGEQLEVGQRIDFELEFTGKSYRITKARVIGTDARPGGGPTLGGAAAEEERAPDFRLTDQDTNLRSLADLRGKAVVLDFIYTHCPGPCPILTGLQVALQRRLPPALRERTAFVSISLDPVRDTPERLRSYAKQRGADLTGWWFLTGDPAVVEDVVRRYGVGSVRQEDGEIQHLVITFLIDPEGRIARRYVGLEHEPEAIERDLARVLR